MTWNQERKKTLRRLILFAIIPYTIAIFEDQIGQTDWRLDHIGMPTASLQYSKKLIVATENGVLACLNADTGDIDWRHELSPSYTLSSSASPIQVLKRIPYILPEHVKERRESGSFLADEMSTVLTVSDGGYAVNLWRVSDGALMWNTATSNAPLGEATHSSGVNVKVCISSPLEKSEFNESTIIILADDTLSGFVTATGKPNARLSNEEILATVSGDISRKYWLELCDLVTLSSTMNGINLVTIGIVREKEATNHVLIAHFDKNLKIHSALLSAPPEYEAISGNWTKPFALHALPKRKGASSKDSLWLAAIAVSNYSRVRLFVQPIMHASNGKFNEAWQEVNLKDALPNECGVLSLPAIMDASENFLLEVICDNIDGALTKHAIAVQQDMDASVVPLLVGSAEGSASALGAVSFGVSPSTPISFSDQIDKKIVAIASPLRNDSVIKGIQLNIVEICDGETVIKHVAVADSGMGMTSKYAPLDTSTYGNAVRLFPFAAKRSDTADSFLFQALVATSGDAIAFWQSGKTYWVRDEALAKVLDVAIVTKSSSEFEKAMPSSSSLLSIPSFSERIGQQKDIFTRFLSLLSDKVSSAVSSDSFDSSIGKDGQSAFTRHKFGLDKVSFVLEYTSRMLLLVVLGTFTVK